MAFLVGGANSPRGYDITNSLRLDSASSAYLYRDQADPTSEGQIYTVSVWNKICFPAGQNATLLEGGDTDGSGATVDETFLTHNVAGTLFFQDALNDSTVLGKQSASLQRDVSAWYHFMLSVDTTQGTDTNRLKVYINGENVSADMTGGWPVQNVVHHINKQVSGANQLAHWIGRGMRGTNYSDMYIADFAFVDGTQLTPSNFGEADEDSGIWKPKLPDVSAWGDNGWFLAFKQTGTGTAGTTTIGADTSGNANHFTTSGIAATDITEDTPTNNFCTLNPLQITSSSTLSEGNTKHTNDGANDQAVAGTMGFANGKWYWEIKCVDKGEIGINLDSNILQLSNDSAVGSNDANIKATSLITNSAGGSNDLRHNGGDESITSVSVSDNDIISIAVDADNGLIWFGKAGTWMGSGDPAAGSNESKDFSGAHTSGNFITPVATLGTGDGDILEFNFGNPPFSISSGNSDDAGYGNFEYDVPAGFYALCSKNLAEYG